MSKLPLTAPPPTVATPVWRVGSAGRIATVCGTAAWVALSALVTAAGGVAVGVVVIVWAATLLVAVGAWRWAFVPTITLAPEVLLIQNRFSRTAAPYTKIVSAQAGYYGIVISMRDGSQVRAWAVQKLNIAKWAKKRTRADDVVEAIMAKAREHELT